jgi:CheY-like chemotaxis protein
VGLGLAIVRSLVELHGGSVRAESPGIGRGATFLVELPLSEAEGLPSAGGGWPQSEVSLSGIRLLLVEDELDNRRVLAVALERSGAEVRSAESALEALVILQHWTPDVLISDIGMPIDDGLSLIANIRRLPRCQHLPGLALTAHAREQDRTRALDAGFAGYLSKPVDLAELAAEVARLAGRR